MKILKFHPIFIALVWLTVLASCHKDKVAPKVINPTVNPVGGIYVLNQGEFEIGKATLTYYNIASKTLVPDQYGVANGPHPDFYGNDIQVYGSKMYIVGGYTIDIVDPKTSKLVKQVNFQGQHITFYKGEALVTSYDSIVAVIDTATCSITKKISLGYIGYSGGIAVAQDKLYVANGSVVDNGVSVIDLTTLTVIKTILVIHGPSGVAADANGNVYVLSPFDDDFQYPDPLPPNYPVFNFNGGITVIDSKTDKIIFQSQEQQPRSIRFGSGIPLAIVGDFVYFFIDDLKLMAFNTKTHLYTNFITDGTPLISPYSLTVNPATGEVFVGDAKNNDATANGSH